jgi:glycolate oxidase
VFGGILLSVEKMNHILEIDRENMVAVVEPGVVTNDINSAVQEYGLFYAGYPMSVEMCYIGGNVAENAGGGRAIKYGVTSRYVMALEVVLPTGEIIHLGGKRLKDVTGYDLMHLMVGSEGTLGIFTKITVRLMPLPGARAVLLVPFPDVKSAISAVPRMMTQGKVIPSSIEFMDRLSIETGYKFAAEPLPHPDLGAMLLLEVDAFTAEQAETEYTSMVDICMDAGALDVYVGDSPVKQKKMWRPRQVMAEAFFALGGHQSIEDIVVPLAQIPELMPHLKEISVTYNVLMPCFGHAGDGNMHIHVIPTTTLSLEEWHELLPRVLTDLYGRVANLGGTISGEHGIGHKRIPYLGLVLEPKVIELERQIKDVFDPNHILNPGKIFA